MSTRLEHKTALVTGATSNIGRTIATAFAAEGAHVIVSADLPGLLCSQLVLLSAQHAQTR